MRQVLQLGSGILGKTFKKITEYFLRFSTFFIVSLYYFIKWLLIILLNISKNISLFKIVKK